MVTVYYRYFSKKTKRWSEYEETFSDPVKALRFIWAMKNREDYYLDGWSCWDPEDNEYLASRISITNINTKLRRKEVKP